VIKRLQLTCHLQGCQNADVPLIVEYSDEYPRPGGATCGGCNTSISDMVFLDESG